MTTEGNGVSDKKLRSRAWFDNPDNADMTALYLERYLNFGLSREELMSGKPIIGIAQTGSDLSPLQPPSYRARQTHSATVFATRAASCSSFGASDPETGKRRTAGQ